MNWILLRIVLPMHFIAELAVALDGQNWLQASISAAFIIALFQVPVVFKISARQWT